MYNKPFFTLLVAFLLVSAVPCWTQGREYIFDHFNISNGLISDNVYKVFLDREGHAWMVTYNGLQKYNGYEFITYTSDAGKSGSLSSNFVKDIFEDRKGDLVVVLEDGIDIYNKKTDRFRNLLRDLPFGELRRNEISPQASAVQDKSRSIWVNCNNQLVRIDSAKGDLVVYTDEEYRGHFVLNGDSSALLMITDRTLKKFDLNHKILTIKELDDIPSPATIRRLNTIFFDSERICWVGTSDGLYVYNEDKNCFEDPVLGYLRIEAGKEVLFKEEITTIYEDFQGDLWVASGSTLRRIDRTSGGVEILQHQMDNPNSILDEQITGIHGNRSGFFWLTYLNEGISRVNIKTQNFRFYRFNNTQNRGLGGNTVRSVFKDRAGDLWVGLYNDGMDHIEAGSGSITHYKKNPEDEYSICSNYISSIFLDRNGRLWVGSHDQGLCVADNAQTGALRFRRTGFLDQNEEIYHILGDSLGRIWIGTRNGLGMYDYRSDQFNWILENHNVQSFLFDREKVWISSWDYGLCMLNFEPDLFGSPSPEFDTASSIFSGPEVTEGEKPQSDMIESGGLRNCISIYQDHRSNIWIGTYDMGLAKAKQGSEGIKYTRYDVSDGAPGNAIYGVLGDEQGNIWISTENGLGKFDPLSEQFENYYREDGLLSDYFMWKSYCKAPDGELYFGSVDGLTLFYPEEIHSDTISPRVFISEFRIQDRLVGCGDTINGEVILQQHITYTDHLVLNDRNNRNFSFTFYATGRVNQEKIRYSYMLSDYDQDWILDQKGNRMATYNNLSSGTYYFRVRATKNDQGWNGAYQELALTILPPWWKTRLAYAIYLAVVIGLVFIITHSLIRFIGLKHELLYSEQLHQSKLMFFTNISHEFKSPLSLIKAPLNDILNQKELSPRNRKNLVVARNNADNLLNLVNELLEFRRTDVGVSKLRAEKIELTGFLRQLVEEFECVSEQKKVNFFYDIPEDQYPVWVDRDKFRKIINNLLENALNYTGEDGLVTFTILKNPLSYVFKQNYHTLQLNNTRKNLEYIGILVSDTGVGISRESLPKMFNRFYQIEAERASHHIGSGIGLALVKNLVLMHHGDIRVGSERYVGTDILVMLPLGNHHLSSEEMMVMQKDHSEAYPVKEGESPAPNSEPIHTKGEGNIGHPHILIVEDHRDLRNYLKDVLSDEYQVSDVPNGKEALQYMQQMKPDLVIVDWIMPVMDGETFIRQIRADERLSAIPVILLTGKSEIHERQAGLELGADLVITKPFSIQLFTSQVRRTIENNRNRIRYYGNYSNGSIEEARNNSDAKFLGLLEEIILKHIREVSLNASDIAAEMGMSRTVLYEKLKSMTGMTIGEYIQRIRLKQTIKLMINEKRSLSEVCVMVGFSSSSYLIRVFKKHYKTTPREYIKTFLKTSSN